MSDKLRALNNVIAARNLLMNCVIRKTSLYHYDWSGIFIRYYKEKVRYENASFHEICSENNWYLICKKNILLNGNCLAATRQSLVTALNS
jgi:hypothetical protein